MENTQYYQLSLWNEEDRILMETFNGNNAKIDAALHGIVQQLTESTTQLSTAVAKCGNCQLYTTTYIGTGTCGEYSPVVSSSGPSSLTFPKKPVFVCIFSPSGEFMFVMRGASIARALNGNEHHVNLVSWSGSTMTWHTTSGICKSQMNLQQTYYVLALLESDI